MLKSCSLSVSVGGGGSNKKHVIGKLQSTLNSYKLALVSLNLPMPSEIHRFYTVHKSEMLPFIDFSDNNSFIFYHFDGTIKKLAFKSAKDTYLSYI